MSGVKGYLPGPDSHPRETGLSVGIGRLDCQRTCLQQTQVLNHHRIIIVGLPGHVYFKRTYMRRILIVTLWSSLALEAFAAQPASAQALPSREEAVRLLETAGHQTSLTGSGAPFHLAAKLHYTVDAISLDGTYEVLWAAAGRFREEFRLGSIGESDVALDGKLYVLRSSPILTYPEVRVRGLTGLPNPPVTPAASESFQISKIYRSGGAGESLLCFDFGSPPTNTNCVDSVTGRLVSVNNRMKLISRVEDRFMSVGAVNYPGHILSTIDHESLEISVDKLETVARFADEVFVPPAGASSRDWCANPDGVRPLDRNLFAKLTVGFALSHVPKGFRGYYAQVGANGRVEQAAEIYADGTARRSVDRDLNGARFPVHSCAGKPIEYETEEILFGLSAL
jgi:hypothetical protein